MKRFVLPMVLLILWTAPHLDSIAYKCVLTNKCTPLPCGFMFELKIERAVLRAVARTPASQSSSQNALNQFTRGFRKELDKFGRKYTKCEPYTSARALSVVSSPPDCAIGFPQSQGGQAQETSLDEELEASSTCRELVEAEYAGAQVQQTFCHIFGNKMRSMATLKAQVLLEQQARVDSLEKSLLTYLSSCAPDAATSRHIAEAGLNALKRAGQKAREDWIAGRASAAGRGGSR